LSINQKVDYWFYYENGNKKKKAIIKHNKNVNGGFYESNKDVSKKKSEFKTTNGLSLFYKKKLLELKIFYGNQNKRMESISEFKKDNKINF
jgi:hypothetical protein